MRIRTVKPEFYRSQDIADLSRENRLLFIGLWSYVDDNGVGIDDHRMIAADLFALDDDQKEVREYVRDGLATLSRGLLIDRYEVDGKRYLFIRQWDKHQRIDRPGRARLPRPPAEYKPPTREDVTHPDHAVGSSRECRDSLDAGTGEQGNRGTGERAPTAVPYVPTDRANDERNALVGTAHSPSAHALAEQYAKTCTRRPPAKVLSKLAHEIDGLILQDWTTDEITRAVEHWGTKGLDPATLHSVANEIANSRPGATSRRNGPATADDKIAALQALKTGTDGALGSLRAIAGGRPA